MSAGLDPHLPVQPRHCKPPLTHANLTRKPVGGTENRAKRPREQGTSIRSDKNQLLSPYLWPHPSRRAFGPPQDEGLVPHGEERPKGASRTTRPRTPGLGHATASPRRVTRPGFVTPSSRTRGMARRKAQILWLVPCGTRAPFGAPWRRLFGLPGRAFA
jgi:hypothetical protein